MGIYNPHAPQILGQEWVPIRDEDIVFSQAVNNRELGHTFTLPSSQVLDTARFYMNEFPDALYERQVYTAAVYAADTEDDAGPVRSVVIPVNNGGITGAAFGNGATTVAQALLDPSDFYYIDIQAGGGVAKNVSLFFAMNQYLPLLAGKRILGVNFLYAGEDLTPSTFELDPLFSLNTFDMFVTNDANSTFWRYPDLMGSTFVEGDVNRMAVGDTNTWFTTGSGFTTFQTIPWTYDQLQRFEASAATRLHIQIQTSAGAQVQRQFFLDYAALEIVYCEERRLAFGSSVYNGLGSPALFYVMGGNQIKMRTLAGVANPVLAAGEYTLTLAQSNFGALVRSALNLGPQPVLNAVREQYQIPPHRGVDLKIPFPTTPAVDGQVLDASETRILPQLSLHTSGGPLTEVHVYGRQAPAQVWGTVTATQEIDTSVLSGVSSSWPWVRFVARRFRDTTVPLTLDSPSVPGSSVTVTPAEFDALSEIADGWKEITLRFASPPAMGATQAPQWRWSATGELAGNRWEVLGAIAPALSGTPGNLLTLAPGANQLSSATYGRPISGAVVNLGWIPGYSPLVSATTDDPASDAFLMFAQDMPTVTGFAVATLSQPLSGIGQQCGVDPCCVPTAIDYNLLTWTATSASMPASGFGHYELQRMDDVDDWQTIMKSSSVTGASFNDYEARVGILTSYRIRAVDVYEFPGLWSATVTVTIPEPGADIGCEGHMLIFTSNERQDGSVNLAYSNAWEGRVEEDFAFPEAGFVQLQPMFNRDYFTAFKPTERGGEQFARTILVQAAAIAPPTLGDFRSLRDMAWEDVSYICVRDDDGNRWLASVVVPAGRVVFHRRIYMAEIQVVEVTATPSPVDPHA